MCSCNKRLIAAADGQDGFERRLELYLMENMRHAFDMPSYIYYTQVMQAECLAAAYRLWRRDWKGRGREYNAGALVWQLNDCWPCVSWAIVDYYLRPKCVDRSAWRCHTDKAGRRISL
jgi:beta-mannosidase